MDLYIIVMNNNNSTSSSFTQVSVWSVATVHVYHFERCLCYVVCALGFVLPSLFSVQFSLVQISLVQISSVQLLTILLLSHITIHFSSVQFNSVQISSVQLFYVEKNMPLICKRKHNHVRFRLIRLKYVNVYLNYPLFIIFTNT